MHETSFLATARAFKRTCMSGLRKHLTSSVIDCIEIVTCDLCNNQDRSLFLLTLTSDYLPFISPECPDCRGRLNRYYCVITDACP